MTLLDQIEDDLKEGFEERQDSYKDTLIKPEYKILPKAKYPMITIKEITNSEMISRSTSQGERTTLLGYQITCYSRDTNEYEYVKSAQYMMDIVDQIISNKYKMRRQGDRATIPYISDNTVMTCTQRYSCVYDKETNLIYVN